MPAVNTFAGGGLDRMGPRRTDAAWLAERCADPASRVVVATSDGVLVGPDGTPATVAVSEVPAGAETVLLGVAPDGAAVFAADPGPERGAALRPEAALVGLRDVAAMSALADANLLAHASGLLNWHRRHRFCANCGHATDSVEAGYVRSCPNCGAQHHPRTDPVVIMLVVDADRVLLGRQPTWPPGRYSALAGFVEPGESLEEAVAREVREEAGVEVGHPEYLASQPWPFPTSLMLGFIAPWRSGEPRRIDHELEDVRWFERAEVEAAVQERSGALGVPPRLAIARRLMEHWVQR